MEMLLHTEEKKGVNKVFIFGLLIAVGAVAAVIGILSLRPSIEEQKQQVLEGSYLEGTPEFEQITKDIIISTDERTVESPTAFGTISMFIRGNIRNKGTRRINGLEVNVAVVNEFNDVLKQRRILVVPVQQPVLAPNETIPINLTMDGFKKSDDRANIRWKVTAIREAK